MKVSQLRDLTRKYAAGKIGREEYLDQRKRLIDGIVAGEIEIRYREIEPPAPPKRNAGQKKWWYAGGTVMLVGLLLIALLAHFFDDGAQRADADRAAAAASPADPGAELLREFLRSADWSDASLTAMEQEWNALTAFQRESARRSSWYRRVKHETSQRIREQEALLAAGEMEALLRAGRLREFAETLGIQTQ